MNERIKKFAIKAGFRCVEPNSTERWSSYITPTGDFVKSIAIDNELEKFAKLLIEETMKQVDERVYGRGHCQWYHEEDRKWIRLHFGYGGLAKLKQQARGVK